MYKKNFSSKDLDEINKKIKILLKNPDKNFHELNNLYKELVVIYYYLKATDTDLI